MASKALKERPTTEERRKAVALRDGTHVPGYRGYIPEMKYSIAKTYGTDTHELKQTYEHKSTGIPSINILPGSPQPTLKNRLPTPAKGDNKLTRDMKPGYTGYIPRKLYKYGGTYKNDCDVCIDEHITIKNNHSEKLEEIRTSATKYPPLVPVSKSASLKDHMQVYKDTHAWQPVLLEEKRPLTEPPMPGYTGYVPRVNATDLGLGVRYHTMSKNGFEKLKCDIEQFMKLRHKPVSLERPNDYKGEGNLRLYPQIGMLPKYTGYIPQRRFHIGSTYGNMTRSSDACAHNESSYGVYNKTKSSLPELPRCVMSPS